MTRLLTTDPREPEGRTIAEAVQILRQGGVILFPTETFYGIGADARNPSAVEQVFAVKGRDFRNPLSVIVAHESDLVPLVAEIPPAARILMRQLWPGPLTLVFHASASVLPRLTAGTGKIGIRISSHPVARLLAAGLAGPLTATSANLSGGPECSSAAEALPVFGENLDAIVDAGRTRGGSGSTILDVTVSKPLILREGAISRYILDEALGASLRPVSKLLRDLPLLNGVG
jgi:L-threonylcarbamoyladenylate synthase